MTPEKNVAKIELYHILALIFSQPQEVVNKYFSDNPHWWSCVGWRKRSHSIHWQDWMFQFFTMFCLIFHTVIIINRKNWRITIKLHFENLSIFFKKRTYIHARTLPPSPCSFLFTFQWIPPPTPTSMNIHFERPLKACPTIKVGKKYPFYKCISLRQLICRINFVASWLDWLIVV